MGEGARSGGAYARRSAMIEILKQMIERLPSMLSNRARWRSIAVHYSKPHVDRAWTQIDEHRLYVHRIHPCSPSDALRHRHRWPSAVYVHAQHGISYRMDVGVGDPRTTDAATTLIVNGSLWYEMVNRDAWHSVAPMGGASMSIMVTAPPWDGATETADVPLLKALTAAQEDELLEWFRKAYS